MSLRWSVSCILGLGFLCYCYLAWCFIWVFLLCSPRRSDRFGLCCSSRVVSYSNNLSLRCTTKAFGVNQTIHSYSHLFSAQNIYEFILFDTFVFGRNYLIKSIVVSEQLTVQRKANNRSNIKRYSWVFRTNHSIFTDATY